PPRCPTTRRCAVVAIRKHQPSGWVTSNDAATPADHTSPAKCLVFTYPSRPSPANVITVMARLQAAARTQAVEEHETEPAEPMSKD
ncbi:MAG: hypothetical protein ABR616_00745, partial [Dermatophilaceae bacterium]